MQSIKIEAFDLGHAEVELHWFTGLHRTQNNEWMIGVVLKEQDGRFRHLKDVPVGKLPILTIGSLYKAGVFERHVEGSSNAEMFIANVAEGLEISSDQLPVGLHDFDGRRTGMQRLFQYSCGDLVIYVPAVELIRYLFLHNRFLANQIMRPSALASLMTVMEPGHYDELHIDFTDILPQEFLRKAFVEQIAWICYDPEGRRSWDSIESKSADTGYITFDPPMIKDAILKFRGVNLGNTWLVHEILHISGRQHPINRIYYSHPSMVRRHVITTGEGETDTESGESGDGESPREISNKKIEIVDGTEAKPSGNVSANAANIKDVSFENAVFIQGIYQQVDQEKAGGGACKQKGEVVEKEVTVKVSAGDLGHAADLPGIILNTLPNALPSEVGDLDVTTDIIKYLPALLNGFEIKSSVVNLKQGRAFSVVDEVPRVALIAVIDPKVNPPFVLIDVQRTGGVALSVLLIRFHTLVTIAEIENLLKTLLDGLVDASGHWSEEIALAFESQCTIERLPRVFSPRSESGSTVQIKKWAAKIANKLRMAA